MQLWTICKGLMLSAAIAAGSSPTLAQTDPASIERTIPKFEARPTEQRPALPTRTPDAQESSRVAGRFVLGAVNIEGATVFGSEELAKSFEPYLASEVGQAELDRIVADITAQYRRAGYLLSYAVLPEQAAQSGIVRIQVVEGYVANVHLKGDVRASAAASAIASRLSTEHPLRTATLERALGLVRDIPGVVVSDTRISRSVGDPTRHELTITLNRDRARAIAYADNRGTIEGARVRSYASVSLPSLVIPGDQLQVDAFAIPSDEFRFFYGQAKASFPLSSSGLRLSMAASFANQFQRVEGPNQHGNSHQFIADISYPFAESRAFSLVGHASLSDWKSNSKRAGALIQRDRFQVARAWLEFTRIKTTRIDGRIGISRGLDLGAATEAGDALASRPRGSASFTKFNLDVQMVRKLSDRVRLRLDTSAQYSTQPLLAPQEFALGGSRIGRAFDFNEVTGDHGVGAMVELSYRLGDIKRGPKAVELFGYADGGGAFRKHESVGLPGEQWLADVGGGARFSVAGFTWSGEIGIPVALSRADRGVRAFFSIVKSL